MPVQVEDIIPAEAAQEEAPPQEEAPAQEEAPPPKRRGRPPGSKNKPKPQGELQDIEEAPKPKANPPAEPVRMKRAVSRKVVIKEESESEDPRTNLLHQAHPRKERSNGPTIGARRWRPTRREQSTRRWTGCSAIDRPRRYSKGTVRPCRLMAAEPCMRNPGTTCGR